jgi:hypothetical protein
LIETGIRQENPTAPTGVVLGEAERLAGGGADGVVLTAIEVVWLQPTNKMPATATQSFTQA